MFGSNNCYPLPEYASEQQQEQHQQQEQPQQQHQPHEALLETCKKQTLTEQISDLCIVEVTEMKKDVKEKTEVKAEVRVYKDGAVQDMGVVQEEQTGAKTSTEKKTKVGANNWLSMF